MNRKMFGVPNIQSNPAAVHMAVDRTVSECNCIPERIGLRLFDASAGAMKHNPRMVTFVAPTIKSVADSLSAEAFDVFYVTSSRATIDHDLYLRVIRTQDRI